MIPVLNKLFKDADDRHIQAVREKFSDEELENLEQEAIDNVIPERSGIIDTCILLPTRELAV